MPHQICMQNSAKAKVTMVQPRWSSPDGSDQRITTPKRGVGLAGFRILAPGI